MTSELAAATVRLSAIRHTASAHLVKIREGTVIKSRRPAVLAAVASLVLASAGWAQTTAGISGTVRDTSGAVLPGVTVEVASPS